MNDAEAAPSPTEAKPRLRRRPFVRPGEAIGEGFFVFRRGVTTRRIRPGANLAFEHASLSAAMAEAERLARALPGQTFEVFASQGRFRFDADGQPETPAFEQFWAAWPNRALDSRERAQMVWESLNAADRVAAWDGLTGFQPRMERVGKRYPSAVTYLINRLWEPV